MEEVDTFLIFLSGYYNSLKQKLIRKIYDTTPDLQWCHFGDINPDGFYIIESLRKGTDIDFRSIYMDADVLRQHKKYTKPLTDYNMRKAKALLDYEMYDDIIRYMIKTATEIVN